jgi:hypothetical protein
MQILDRGKPPPCVYSNLAARSTGQKPRRAANV